MMKIEKTTGPIDEDLRRGIAADRADTSTNGMSGGTLQDMVPTAVDIARDIARLAQPDRTDARTTPPSNQAASGALAPATRHSNPATRHPGSTRR